MHINARHLLDEAEYYPSPHKSIKTQEDHPSLVVLHSISFPPGEYGTDAVRQLFLGQLDYDNYPSFPSLRGIRVSAHIFLRRNGSLLQFVPFNEAAWHAGESSYEGRTGANDFSLGIELEGSEQDGYEDIQYEMLVQLSAAFILNYPHINGDTFVGHKDIALPRGRKNDPWNFDYRRFRALLES